MIDILILNLSHVQEDGTTPLQEVLCSMKSKEILVFNAPCQHGTPDLPDY